jgi:dTDP-4-dehydrorhamnose reductase
MRNPSPRCSTCLNKAVIHAAGNKNVKFCEEHPEEAIRINALGTRNIARACHRTGSKLVYISTDVVFNGERGFYREDDIPRPKLAYGQSKLEGEQWAQAEFPGAAICRTGGVYGKSSPLLKWLDNELSNGRSVEAFTDVVNTPTYVENLAEMIEAIVERDLGGVLHTAGSQRVSRYQLFQSYARIFGLDETLVRPVTAGERRARMLLQADSSLSVERTASLVGVPFDSVDVGLERLRQAGGV